MLQNSLSHVHRPRIKNLKIEIPEKLKLFKAIKIPELFPSLRNARDIQTRWDKFKKIYELLWSSKNMDEQEIKDFKERTTNWITLCTSLYQTKNVTPYMHVLIAHVPKLLRDVGSLAKFSQQGLEKLNDDITKAYFKSTNHRNEEALRQIMLKLNRLLINNILELSTHTSALLARQ